MSAASIVAMYLIYVLIAAFFVLQIVDTWKPYYKGRITTGMMEKISRPKENMGKDKYWCYMFTFRVQKGGEILHAYSNHLYKEDEKAQMTLKKAQRVQLRYWYNSRYDMYEALIEDTKEDHSRLVKSTVQSVILCIVFEVIWFAVQVIRFGL